MDYKNFTIVLPTLNEEKNIGILIVKLLKEYSGVSILVVDDGSKDMTRQIVSKLAHASSHVRLINRAAMGRQRGLTASAVDGISYTKTRYAIVMDADLQHPAEIIRKVSHELKDGKDLVVAIRADVHGWALHRKIISKSLIMLGYALLVLRNSSRCNDIFSGFFGVDKKLFMKTFYANRNRFVPGGYKILYDFLKCKKNGSMKIGEVPYSFGLRKFGASKAGFKQGMLLFKSFLT